MSFNLVSKNNLGIFLTLLLVVILSQTKFFNFLLDTVLGRTTLIAIILGLSYINKNLGVIVVMFIIIMFSGSNIGYLEGFDGSGNTITPSTTTSSSTTAPPSTTTSSTTSSTTSPSTTVSATFHDFGGCRTFSSCILLFHRYAVSAAIDDAAHYGASTLAEGLGLDYLLIHDHITQVNSSGILDFINTLSMKCLGLTLHPRQEMILSPPPRIRSLPVQPIHSLSFTPSLEVVCSTAVISICYRSHSHIHSTTITAYPYCYSSQYVTLLSRR
jgi:hypothetical protein